jgi:hypothetical protein
VALQEFTHAHHEKLVAMTRAKIAKRNKMSRSNPLAQYLVLGSSTLKIVPSSEELINHCHPERSEGPHV